MRNVSKSRLFANQKSIADRARRDGRMMAVLLKVSPPRSDLVAFHRLFNTLADTYSRLGYPEFENEYYRRIR